MKNKKQLPEQDNRPQKSIVSAASWQKFLLHQMLWNVIPTLIMLLGVGWFFLNVAENLQTRKHINQAPKVTGQTRCEIPTSQ